MIFNYFRQIEQWVRSPFWLRTFLIATVVCVLVYASNLVLSEVHPGNWWGISYGTAATFLMVGAALIGVRRRSMNRAAKQSLGKSREWLQFHLYAGTLAAIFVLMHGGFTLPSGALNWWLWLLTIWVTISGLIGVAIQRVVPRMLASGLTTEVVYERIPELIVQIREGAEKLVETCTDPVRDFYRRNLVTVLGTLQPRAIYYVDITGGIQSRVRQFDYLRKVLSAEEKEKLDRLETLFRTKLEMDAHYTLQRALRWWLYTHVPLSLVLLVLIAIHLYAVWYY
ncbi:MAG: hypothetical protein ACKVRP_06150 [Bacteroidota bacterium]